MTPDARQPADLGAAPLQPLPGAEGLPILAVPSWRSHGPELLRQLAEDHLMLLARYPRDPAAYVFLSEWAVETLDALLPLLFADQSFVHQVAARYLDGSIAQRLSIGGLRGPLVAQAQLSCLIASEPELPTRWLDSPSFPALVVVARLRDAITFGTRPDGSIIEGAATPSAFREAAARWSSTLESVVALMESACFAAGRLRVQGALANTLTRIVGRGQQLSLGSSPPTPPRSPASPRGHAPVDDVAVGLAIDRAVEALVQGLDALVRGSWRPRSVLAHDTVLLLLTSPTLVNREHGQRFVAQIGQPWNIRDLRDRAPDHRATPEERRPRRH